MSQPESIRLRLWRRFLVVAGLIAVGVVYPLLDLYGKNPEVFVANHSSAGQIIFFGFLVAVGPLLVAVAILAIGEAVGPRTARAVYYGLVGVTAAGTGLVISRQVAPDAAWMAAGIAVIVMVLLFAIHHFAPVVLRAFALAGPLVLILFLTTSPTSRLIWSEPAEPTSLANTVGNPGQLVFLQFDEFPIASILDKSGQVNEALFPNFARLAAESTWYRNAFSNSIATTQSVPAILTGKIGEKGDSPSAVDHPENLFTLLEGAYEMHVIEWVTEMCPEDVCEEFAGRAPARFASLLQDLGVVYGHLSLPAPIRENLPSIDNSWKGFLGQVDDPRAPAVAVDAYPVPPEPDRADWVSWLQRIINGLAKDAPPTLSFVHAETPHAPWQVNPSGTQYERPEQYDEVDGVETGGHWVNDPRVSLLGFQRHLLQLGFLDSMLGELLDKLDESGAWDDTMLVLVADHGASFVAGEHRRWPEEENREDLYRIPLFVKYPGEQAGQVIDDPAFGVDILPTIVEVLDVQTDWTFDGISLLDIEGTSRPHEPLHWCCNPDGVATDLSSLYAQIERNHEWIPDQGSWRGVTSVGPYASMVGTRVESLAPSVDSDLHWSLENADDIESVDRESGYLQTLLFGRLELPDADPERDLLVAVNGTIAGTGFLTVDGPGSADVRALISEDLIVEGPNTVQILVKAANGGWMTGDAADLAVEYVADDGHVLALRPEGGKRITVDSVSFDGRVWTVTGWAADVVAKKTPDRIYVFVGEDLVAADAPNVDNPNVVRWYKSDDLLRSGFVFEIDPGDIPSGVERITIVAEFGNVAILNPVTLVG